MTTPSRLCDRSCSDHSGTAAMTLLIRLDYREPWLILMPFSHVMSHGSVSLECKLYYVPRFTVGLSSKYLKSVNMIYVQNLIWSSGNVHDGLLWTQL